MWSNEVGNTRHDHLVKGTQTSALLENEENSYKQSLRLCCGEVSGGELTVLIGYGET
jgi:hypothetical protein